MQGSLMADIEGLWLTAEDRAFIRHPEVGGLILFTRNTEHPQQVRELCRSIRAVRPDLLLAIDQEGGRVQRLRRNTLTLPSMRAIAESGDAAVQLARDSGWLMAVEVLACGLDISFAPVLDLDYGRSAVIGSRSFGDDQEQVTLLAGAFIQGMKQAGMVATGKHFPGHGWVKADSHVALPVDERSFDQIRAADLQPFVRLAPLLGGIMPAHVIYSQVDDLPAGFSRRWLQDILRGELKFQGVIFSDDLSMAGAHVVGSVSDRVAAALVAGCDMVLVCNDRGAAEEALNFMQQQRILPAICNGKMRSAMPVHDDYKQQPDWLQAVMRLRQAGLLA